MKRLLLVLLLVAALFCATTAQGQIGVTYADKVMWRGFELFGESDGVMPQAKFSLGPVDLAARGMLATDSGYQALERWDGQVSYTQAVGPVNVTGGYGYYYYPDSDLDFQEVWATLGVPIGPLTPRYTLVRADGDGPVESAWLHVLGVDWQATKEASLFGEIVYNDGFDPGGGSVPSDWSHVVAGASLDIPLVAERLILTPSIYYQRTLEDAVNPEANQVWYSVGLAYTF